jgi:hypothetical protein
MASVDDALNAYAAYKSDGSGSGGAGNGGSMWNISPGEYAASSAQSGGIQFGDVNTKKLSDMQLAMIAISVVFGLAIFLRKRK